MSDSRPKKPLNAYFRYRKEFFEEDIKNNAGATDRTERYNIAWNGIDAKKKEKLEHAFHKEMEMWKPLNEQWKLDNPDPPAKKEKKSKKEPDHSEDDGKKQSKSKGRSKSNEAKEPARKASKSKGKEEKEPARKASKSKGKENKEEKADKKAPKKSVKDQKEEPKKMQKSNGQVVDKKEKKTNKH